MRLTNLIAVITATLIVWQAHITGNDAITVFDCDSDGTQMRMIDLLQPAECPDYKRRLRGPKTTEAPSDPNGHRYPHRRTSV